MTNSCIITFEGLNVNRMLNTLCNKGIPVIDVQRKCRTCTLQVPLRYGKQVVALLNEKCYNITCVKNVGVSAIGEFVRKHIVLSAITVVTLVVLLLLSKVLLKIEVSGDFDEQIVVNALTNANVTKWNKFDFDTDKLENALCNELDAMYVEVQRVGSVLYVNAVSKKSVDTPIDMKKHRNIVATCSGVVEYALCEQGTLCVNVGSYVNKGDVLISGVRSYNDGTTENVYALGKVIITVSVDAFVEFDGTVTKTVQGESTVVNKVTLFGKDYGKSCPYENYCEQSTVTYLYPLNIAVKRITYTELVAVTESAEMSDCVDELKNKAYERALSKCNFAVTNVTYVVQNNGVKVILYGKTVVQ